jgi:hypothetical protein
MLQQEKAKNENVETDLYEEFENRLKQMKSYMVDKLDEYIEFKTAELRESVRREVMSDPRMVEHKMVLESIVEKVAGYLSAEDYTMATSKRMEESIKKVEELQGQVRLLEARHIRVSTENNKLNEHLRQAGELLSESRQTQTKKDKNARIDEAKKVTGKGERVVEGVKVIGEHQEPASKTKKPADTTLVEAMSAEELRAVNKLAGTLADEE